MTASAFLNAGSSVRSASAVSPAPITARRSVSALAGSIPCSATIRPSDKVKLSSQPMHSGSSRISWTRSTSISSTRSVEMSSIVRPRSVALWGCLNQSSTFPRPDRPASTGAGTPPASSEASWPAAMPRAALFFLGGAPPPARCPECVRRQSSVRDSAKSGHISRRRSRPACGRSGPSPPVAPVLKLPRPSSPAHRRQQRAHSRQEAGGRRTRRTPSSSGRATRC